MMLTELLSGYVETLNSIDVTGLSLDSRKIKSGDAFIALSGASHHGIKFARQAINNGAVVILYEPVGEFKKTLTNLGDKACVAVEGLSQKIGMIAARFFGFPAQQLSVVGVTGTNGKTTCSQLLGQSLTDCGIIGTLGWGEFGHLNAIDNTTPDAISIQAMLHSFVSQKKTTVAMEVSSHGLEQGRVNGVAFTGAVYTNISRDHLDYHGSMESYVQAKLKLLGTPGLKFVVINMDDQYAQQIISAVPDKVSIYGFTRKQNRTENIEILSAKNIEYTLQGIQCDLNWHRDQSRLKTSLIGEFNLENVLAVVSALIAMGHNLDQAVLLINRVLPIDGRMERITNLESPFQVFVDYAHTPDALERLLKSARSHCDNKLFLVFGCGGDRDQGKRPIMGRIAEQWADAIVLTNDNPRYENAEKIIDEILQDCPQQKFTVIADRELAIRNIIKGAESKSIVLIAGKGHENYQEFAGVKEPFNDRKVAIDALRERGVLPC